MHITITKGKLKGKKAELIGQTSGLGRRLCGGPTTQQSVTALVDGMLYPMEFSPSEVSKAKSAK